MKQMICVGLCLFGAVSFIGCGGSEADSEEQALTPQVESAPPQPDDKASLQSDEVAATLGGGSEPIASDGSTDIEIDTSVPNAVHPRAGRSAFPGENESAELIAAKRFSDEDQFASPIDETDIPDIVPWDQAKKYVGHEITVEGKIVNVGRTQDGSVNFLNFHQDWRGKFYMVIFDDLAKTLPQSVEATFKGKTLRVTGEVEDHRGRPQIKILSMDQVEIVGG